MCAVLYRRRAINQAAAVPLDSAASVTVHFENRLSSVYTLDNLPTRSIDRVKSVFSCLFFCVFFLRRSFFNTATRRLKMKRSIILKSALISVLFLFALWRVPDSLGSFLIWLGFVTIIFLFSFFCDQCA